MRLAAMKKFLIAIVLATLINPAAAQTLFINDGTVHTMGSQAILQQTDILVRDGVVTSLGQDLEAPADATVIEANGRPVTPGMFAGITGHGLVEISAVEESVDSGLSLEGMRPEFDVTLAFTPHSTLIPVTRIEGFTWTVLGAGRSASIISGQGRSVRLDGGYQSFTGDKVLYINVGRDASSLSGGSRAAQWMLLEQALSEAGSELEWSPQPLLTPAGRQALDSFRNSGTVVFDVDRASDILQTLRFAEEHGFNPVISGGTEAWMVAEELAEAGVPVLLNSLENLPGNFDKRGARLDSAALLNEAGVTIVFNGAGTHHARKLRQLAGNAVANGLPWDAALAALTVNPANAFGLAFGTGQITEGGSADLVIWSGDPLEVTTAADQVVIGGRAVEMVSRQTLLRDRYLPEDPGKPRAYVKP